MVLLGDRLRLNRETSTKIGLDQLDSLCCMMEELSLLREQNSRLQKQLNFMEVSMKARAAFGSMGSMKIGGSGSSDLLLGSSRSRTGRWLQDGMQGGSEDGSQERSQSVGTESHTSERMPRLEELQGLDG